MANDNSTRPDPLPVEAEYFECPEGSPSVLDLLMALDGVCSALDAEAANLSIDDDDQVNRVTGLCTASAILAKQFYSRFTTKPRSKRQLEKGRKARAEWLEARERLAGPAEGTA